MRIGSKKDRAEQRFLRRNNPHLARNTNKLTNKKGQFVDYCPRCRKDKPVGHRH